MKKRKRHLPSPIIYAINSREDVICVNVLKWLALTVDKDFNRLAALHVTTRLKF